MHRSALVLMLIFLPGISKAQSPCGTDDAYQYLVSHDKAYADMMKKRRDAHYNPLLHRNPGSGADTIPVVVHVISSGSPLGSPLNPSDQDIENMILYLNQAFSATYPGHPGVNNGGVDMGIFFMLARTDPSCHATNGIIRIDGTNDAAYMANGVNFGGGSSGAGISQAQLAAKSYWNNLQYFNIWLVNKLSNLGYQGFAYFPSGMQTIYDGIVMMASFTNIPYLIAHEMGHSFDLYHTFQGSSGSTCPVNNNCNQDGDKVCDTPPVLGNTGSATQINPCTNQPFGTIGKNYMSYEEHTLFTPLQRERMRAALFTYRASLLNANTELPPPQAPAVVISHDDTDNIICHNQSLSFKAIVQGNPSQVSYEWLKNNVVKATSQTYTLNDPANGDAINCRITVSAPPCINNAIVSSNTIILSVINPNPVITQNGYTLSTVYHPQATYQWYLNGTQVTGANSSSLPVNYYGSYTVSETQLSCTSISDPLVISAQGQQSQTVSVFPNPFRSAVNVQTNANTRISGITILGIDGKLLKRQQLDNSNLVLLSLSRYPPGIYILVFDTNRGRHVVKVVKAG